MHAIGFRPPWAGNDLKSKRYYYFLACLLFVSGDLLMWLIITLLHITYTRNPEGKMDVLRKLLDRYRSHIITGTFMTMFLFSNTIHPFRPAVIMKHMDYNGV